MKTNVPCVKGMHSTLPDQPIPFVKKDVFEDTNKKLQTAYLNTYNSTLLPFNQQAMRICTPNENVCTSTNLFNGMKKAATRMLAAFFVFALTAFAVNVSAQTAGNYSFSTAANASLTDMSTGTTTLVAASTDDGSSTVQNIGFTFTFAGTAYTQFSASSNGVIRLGNTTVSSTIYGGDFPVSSAPIIAPYMQDLATSSTGKVHFKVIGSAPNRVLVVEFLNMKINYSSTTVDGTFQARLYETTNVIEFVYGSMKVGGTTTTASRIAAIGISNTTGAGNEISVNQSTYATTTAATPITNTNSATGTITGLNSTAQGSRRIFTFAPPTIATGTISGSPFCPGATVTVPFTSTGTYNSGNVYTAQASNSSGSFTSPTSIGTLTSTANSGNITATIPTGASAGTGYRIRVVSSSPSVTGTDNGTNLTVSALPTATIVYSGSPYCSNGGTATVTQTGQSGGTYSSTAGLSINSSTGDINLAASTAGTYTVTYSFSNGCSNSTTASVTITAAPSATISYAGSPYCTNGGTATVTRTGTAGGTYTASPAGLTISSTTGTVTLSSSTPGTYTVTYTVAAANGCAQYQTTAPIVVNATPTATISYAGSPYCSSAGTATVTQTGQTGGTYAKTSGTGTLALNAATGAIDLASSTAGTYTVTYSFSNGNCSSTTTANITITAQPSATISYAGSPYCSNAGTASVTRTGTTGGTYSSTAGLTINSGTGAVTLGSSTAGTYTVTYTVAAANGCSQYQTTTQITITALPTANISYSGSPYCSNAGTATVTRTGNATGTYSSTAGLSINSGTGDINLGASTAGTYTVTYTIPAGSGCSAVTATTSVTINPAPTANSVTICQGGSGSLTSTFTCANGSGVSSGAKNAGTGADVTGTGSVTWSTPGNITSIGSPYATVSLSASFGSTPTSHYLQGTNYGFTIPTNATIIGIQVSINRQSSGGSVTDDIVKLVKGGSIVGTDKGTSTAWPTTLGVANYGTTSDLWGTTWTPANINASNFGVVLSATNGAFSSRTATVDYMQITVTYTVPGDLNWYTQSSGGTAIGSGASFNPVGVANSGLPDTKTPGTYTYYVECSTAPGCRTAADFVINPAPDAPTSSGDVTICQSETPATLSVTPPSGATIDWYADATGGTALQSGSNIYSTSTAGTYYAESRNTTTNCTSLIRTAVILTINTAPTISSCPGNISVNNDPNTCGAVVTYTSPTITGTPTPDVSYTFSGATTGSGTGTGSGSTFNKGTTTVTITAHNSCSPDASCSFNITVNDNQAPVADVDPLPTVTGECSATVAAAPTATDNCAGTITATTTDPLTYTTQGTYTITWTYDDGNGNTSTQQQTVVVDDVTNPTITAPAAIAVNNDPGQCGATISDIGTPTTNDNCGVQSVTNDHPLATYPVGTTIVTWTVTDIHGNTNTATQNVVVTDAENPIITGMPANITKNNDAGVCGAAVTWTAPTVNDNCPDATIGANHQSGDVFPVGTTTVTYTATDAHNNSVQSSFTVTVTDNESPVITGCPSNIVSCSSNVSWVAPTASDNCGMASFTSNYTSPHSFPTGTTTVTYTATDIHGNTSICSFTVTVDPLPKPGTISGTTPLCVGTTTTFTTNGDLGGVWSSNKTNIATVDASTGAVTGVSAGAVTIKYTINTSCGSSSATKNVTVTGLPNAGTINGSSSVCQGASITLTKTGTSGGTWSSSNTSVATVNSSTGVVTGVAAGTTTITYSVTGTCGTASATKTITVNAAPQAGTISGSSSVCTNATTTYSSNGATGGTWSSTNTSVATVSSTGLVKGISAGTATIRYRVSNTCGADTAFKVITVNQTPVAGTITGTSPICPNSSTTFTSSGTPGGTWSSTNTGIATVDASTGVVTGVAAGTTTIRYTITNDCGTATATKSVTVSAAPNAGTINGPSSVCEGSTITLTKNGQSGGTWSSSDASIATVDGSGVVTGVAAGTVTITYTVSNACSSASATKSITVKPTANAGSISGASSVCTGVTTTLTSNGQSGGTWSSSNTAIATVSSTGLVKGIAAGTVTITYTVNGCGTSSATQSITVNQTPNAGTISGTTPICVGSTTTFSSTGTPGGTWSSNNSLIASVDPSTGVVTGVAPGTTSIVYTVSTPCGTVSKSKAIKVQNCTASPAIAQKLPEPFSVTIMNNPSLMGTDFVLYAKASDKEPIVIQVLNMLGGKVYETKGFTNQTYRFGAQFISGMYLIQVWHGDKVRVYKVIKGG